MAEDASRDSMLQDKLNKLENIKRQLEQQQNILASATLVAQEAAKSAAAANMVNNLSDSLSDDDDYEMRRITCFFKSN